MHQHHHHLHQGCDPSSDPAATPAADAVASPYVSAPVFASAPMQVSPAARTRTAADSSWDVSMTNKGVSVHTDVPSDVDVDAGSDTGTTGTEYEHSAAETDALKQPTSPTSPLAPFPPLAPTDTRSRAPEFYGFVAWTGTYLFFIFYLLWAFLPDELILAAGVAWYPNREWALLIPAYGMVLVLLTYFTYFALALAGTPAFSDMRTITDSKAHLPPASIAASASDTSRERADKTDCTDDAMAPSGRAEPSEADAQPEPGLNADSGAATASRNPKPKSRLESTLTGKRDSSPPRIPRANPYFTAARPDSIPELYDIPLGLVNRVVYGPPLPRRPAPNA